MDQRAPGEGQYDFGSFRLDPAGRALTRNGTPVALTYRVFETLLFLVRNPGRLLTKDEIMDAVWPGRIVDEGSLTQAVFTLRKALGASDEDKRYIATVPGRGYCFTAPVQNVAKVVPVATPADAVPPARRRSDVLRMAAGAVIGVLALAATGTGVVLWRHGDKPSAPAKPVSMVVADFRNLTRDPLLAATFTAATKADLQQPPSLVVAPDSVIADIFEMMTRPRSTALTPALAPEVCARNNGQVAIEGAVAQAGANYFLTLTAVSCVNEQTIWTEKSEVTTRDALLPALDRLSANMRQRLLAVADTIPVFEAPLPKKRTVSLDALKVYAQARDVYSHGKMIEAVGLFQRAIELDPDFAVAYADLSAVYGNLRDTKQDLANITRAYDLRDNATEKDSLFISVRYGESVTKDVYATLHVLKTWTELYPEDAAGWGELSNQENWIGEYPEAVRDGRQGVALEPGQEGPYVVLARAYIHSGAFDQAAAVLAQAVRRHLDGADTHRLLLQIAFVRQGMAGVEREMQWAAGKPAERIMLIEAGQAAFAAGQVHRGLEIFTRVLELGKSQGLANYMAAANARLLYDLGAVDLARESLAQVPPGPASADTRIMDMRIGDAARTTAGLRADLAAAPSDTLLNESFAPQAYAALDLRNGKPLAAVDALKPALPIELRTFDVPYLRGLAYLAAHDGADAAAEFRKVLDNRGVEAVSSTYPLAELGLARALRLEGDLKGSGAAYRRLFVLWKAADANLPPLRDAQREYRALAEPSG